MGVTQSVVALESRWIAMQMEQRIDHHLAERGFSTVQAHVLLHILRHADQGTSLTQIHRAFGYSMPSLCSILKRLRKNDYVRVEPDPGDDRRKLLFPTAQAFMVEPFLLEVLGGCCSQVYRGLSEEELEELHRLQQVMIQNLGVPKGASDPCQEA